MSRNNESVLPSTSARVPQHTSVGVNERIRLKTVARLSAIGFHPPRISVRLKELEREWDIERAIETNASILALVGIALGAFVDPLWLILPAAITVFLLQHALQGWCPPVPVLRRLGFRTLREIDNERTVLKLRRGDFDKDNTNTHEVLASVEKSEPPMI